MSECEVRVGIASDVEAIRLVPGGVVAVRRAVGHPHERVRRHGRVPQGDVFERQASADLVGTVEAEHLLDCRGHQIGALAQQLELIGMAEQSVHAAPDQVRGGLVSGVQQECSVVQQLHLGEGLAVLLGTDEDRHQIVARFSAAPVSKLTEVTLEVLDCGIGPIDDLLGGVRLQRRSHRRSPGLESLTVVGGDAEHLPDHGEGQEIGEVADEVHLAVDEGVGEQLVDGSLDLRLP